MGLRMEELWGVGGWMDCVGLGDEGIVGSGGMRGLCGVGGCGNCVGWVG